MVIKLASPPMTFDIGSDKNTPMTPKPILGRIITSGTTIMAFLKSEKNIACFEYPSAVKVDCPVNMKAINTNPKKYVLSASAP